MKLTLLAAAIVGLLFGAVYAAGPAHALTGTWTKVEFNTLCTTQDNFTVGCSRANTQAEAEGPICGNCTGVKIADWNAGGFHRKRLQYNGAPVGVSVLVDYKDTGSKWVATDNVWCDPDRCYDLTVPVR